MITIDTAKGVLVAARAELLSADHETAWAEDIVRLDPDIRWIRGNFVQADKENDNGHIFPLDDLRAAADTPIFKALNVWHRPNLIVGAFAGTHLENVDVAQNVDLPHLEALAALWRTYFPKVERKVEDAYAEGSLYFSMECVAKSLTCKGRGEDPGCGATFPYMGRVHESYCSHLMQPRARRVLNGHRFTAGALILPPVRPGWRDAEIVELARWLEHPDAAETYAQIAEDSPHLDTATWEVLMAQVLAAGENWSGEGDDGFQDDLEDRDFTTEQRGKLAEKGLALPDGSYPIVTVQDLRNAVAAYGRAPEGKRDEVRKHIMKRAKALGAESVLPDDWQS